MKLPHYSPIKGLVLTLLIFFYVGANAQQATISGELKQFHKLSLTWSGPQLTEEASTFKNYRLNVEFTSPTGIKYTVPGYFAADGNAGESSAGTGNKWRCHFSALEPGQWTYSVSFRTGPNIAASLSPSFGTPISFNGDSGSFQIGATDKTGVDFRSKGRLQYVGEHFLQWTDGDYFLKLGTNSPEILLLHNEFDNTSGTIDNSAHVQDWVSGDPTWQGGKGKGVIGVINYLSNESINVHYFVTHRTNEAMSPFLNPGADHYTYDVSKLDQWQILFDHMMEKGLMAHFVFSESTNQSIFEKLGEAEGDPSFADGRKIYFREMIARFGYLNAVTWNIGEENAWNRNSGNGQALTSAQQLAFAKYIDDLAYYNDNIVVHNGPAGNDNIYNSLMGPNSSFTGTSLQGIFYNTDRSIGSVIKWRNQSAANGKKWVVAYDEAYWGGGIDNPTFRENVVWATLISGGAGVEHYFTQGNDVVENNYRNYALFWQDLRNAGSFFSDNNIPYQLMSNQDAIVSNGRCLGQEFEHYVVYLPNGGSTTIDITGQYSVQWYDPRNGGALQSGSVGVINSGTGVSLGTPPNATDQDWVVYLKNIQEGAIPVTDIAISQSEIVVGAGVTSSVDASVIPANADNKGISYSSNNTSVATVDAAGVVTGVTAGSAIITATSDDGGFTDTVVVQVLAPGEFCVASGTIKYERYEGIPGCLWITCFNAAAYPDSPTFTTELSSFEAPINVAEEYGARISGYLCAPETGTYYFWVSGDDNSQLNLSSNELEANKTTIAVVNGWTSPQQWNKYTAQASQGIALEFGKTYYIEAIVKEAGGGDNLAVGWRKPSDGPGSLPVEVIPGSVLAPDLASTIPDLTPVTGVSISPNSLTLDVNANASLSAVITPADADNKGVTWTSYNTGIATVSALGEVIAVGPGVTTITVLTNDGGFQDSITVTVNDDNGGGGPPIDTPVSFAQSEANFNGLSDISAGTSLTFGPDGRLYVVEYTGLIKIYTFQRTEEGEYIAQDVEVLTDIQAIQDHNDDGSLFTNTNRETLGIAVAGTAQAPVLYVTSSDFRIGGGGGGGNGDLGLDTNSGIITRFTWTGTDWDVVDIVRGLPRSEENHASNGLEFTTINGVDYLIMAQGGHTNGGAPSTNFAYTTEYALSAAVLSINLDMIDALPVKNDNGRKYIYDLPTLDDPTRPNVNGITDPNAAGYDGIDVNDPFGGNDGLNQAILDVTGPVQIYSPGYRNAYDLVVTEGGALYVTDNGANGGWGGFPENEGNPNTVTNNYLPSEPGSSSPSGGEQINNEDNLIKVTSNMSTYVPGSFYGGHPNPVRANPEGAGLFIAPNTSGLIGATFRTQTYDPNGSTAGSTTDVDQALPANWPPIPLTEANPVEADWRGPGEDNPDGPEKAILTIWGTNTNGIDEYTATNFGGAMKGDLIAGVNTGVLRRVQLDDNGDLALLTPTFASGLGGNALGITCNSDTDPFPGTIWSVTLNGKLIVLEPQDFIDCVDPADPSFDPLADYDLDGYTNQDEIDNGTDPCNGGSQPNDFDKSVGGVLISDLNDTDDDNDGVLDSLDPFQLGQPNAGGSDAFNLPIQNELFSDNPLLQGYLGLGFTGLMNNGDANPNWLNWLDRRDDPNEPNPNDILGGAIGAMTMQMTSGTAEGAANTQEKAFQYGIRSAANTGLLTVQGSLVNFNDPLQLYGAQTPAAAELGIFIGDGTQSNYIKVVLTQEGVKAFQEIDDVPQTPLLASIAEGDRPNSGTMFYLEINSVTGLVTIKYSFDGNAIQTLGTIQAEGAILQAIQNVESDLAAGLIGTSGEAGKEVEGTWDLLNAFDESGLEIIDKAIARVNAGGTLIPSTDGEVNWDDNAQEGAQTELSYNVNTGVIVPSGLSFAARDASIPDYVDEATFNALFAQERYDVLDTEEMVYTIPVQNGYYRVNLYMGNSFVGTQNIGDRVFDIKIEDQLTFNNVDLIKEFGQGVAGMLSEVVAVSDGEISIEFIHQIENPLLNGIEIINVQGDVFPITVPNISDQESIAGGAPANLQITATGGNAEETFTYGISGQPEGITIDEATGLISGSADANAFLGGPQGDGLYEVEVTVSKPSSFVQKRQFNWLVLGPLTIKTVEPQETIVGSPVLLDIDVAGGTLEQTYEFSMSGAPAGLFINPTTGVVTGMIEESAINGGPLGDGVYTVLVDVINSADESAQLSFQWTALSFPTVLYRINAAGGAISSSDPAPDWEANNVDGAQVGNSYSVNTGLNFGAGLSFFDKDESIPFYIDEATFTALFAEERYDLDSGEEMKYSLPVQNAEYRVNIYLGNSFGGTNDIGDRVYSINIEDQLAFGQVDPVALFGHKVGGMLSYDVQVTDGVLDIEFIHEVENPLVSGIEVISLSGDLNPISVQAFANQASIINDAINLAVNASGGDPNKNFVYSLEGQPAGVIMEPTNGLISGTVGANAFIEGVDGLGTHEVVLRVEKPGSFPYTQSFTWTVSGPLSANPVQDQQVVVSTNVNLQVEAFGGTVGEAVNYQMNGAPAGLTIDPNTGLISGVVDANADTAGPNSDGVYPVSITVSQEGETDVVLNFNWTVSGTPTIIYRINAGGGLVVSQDDGPDWEANGVVGPVSGDNYSVNTGEIVPSGLSFADKDASIPSYINASVFEMIFGEERYDTPLGEEMTFSVPLLNGTYIVNLYMGNSFAGTNSVGSRVFGIDIEGTAAFTGVDLVAQFGHKSGGMLSTLVEVNDGVLDITFLHDVENPLINAIEIGTNDPNLVPLSLSSISEQRSEVGSVVELDKVRASGGNEALPFSFSVEGQPDGIAIDPVTGVLSGTVTEIAATGGPQADGVHTVTITASKTGFEPATTSFVWTVGPYTWLDLQEDLSYTSRHENSFVQAGERFYVMGGRENPKTLDVYDYQTDSWSSLPDSPPEEFNHFQAVQYKGLIWVIGAFKDNTFPVEVPAEYIWAFDPVAELWYKGPKIPQGRQRGSAGLVVYNDKFYVVAGNTIGHDGGYVAWFDEYDPYTGEWTPLTDAPRPRDHFHAAVIDNKLYAVGGRLSGGEGGTFGPTIGEVDVYDFTTSSWSTLPADLPTPRGASTTVNFRNQLFVIGGEVENQQVYGEIIADALVITEAYDPSTGQWTRMPDMNHDRHGTQAIVSGEGIFILGGSDNLGGGNQQNLEVFGNPNPEGTPLTASTLNVPEALTFVPGESLPVELQVQGGSVGMMIESMVITGSQKYSLEQEVESFFIGPDQTASFAISLTEDGLDEIAVLTIFYNNGQTANVILSTGGEFDGLVNPGDQLNQEGDIVQLPIIQTDQLPQASYVANNLPAGLSIDGSSGLISGTVQPDVADGRFVEKDGLLVVEAESVPLNGGWFLVDDGSEVGIQSNTNHFNNLTGGQLTYKIRIQEPGIYRVIWNSLFTGTNGGNKNDSWLKFANDNGVWFFGHKGDDPTEQQLKDLLQGSQNGIVFPAGSPRVTPETAPAGSGLGGFFKVFRSLGDSEEYDWQANVNDEDPYLPYVWFEQAGDYEFIIGERSEGHRIDKIVLYRQDVYDLVDTQLNNAEQSQIVEGVGGAANGSPYLVQVDYVTQESTESVNFLWTITEYGDTGDSDECVQETTLSSDDFEQGGGTWVDGGADAQLVNNAAFAASGTFTYGLQDNSETSYITSPSYDLTNFDKVTVSFSYYVVSFDNENEDFWLQISQDGGTTFTTVEEWSLNDEFTNNELKSDVVEINGPFSAATQFRFRADASGNADDVYLDDIIITACASSVPVEDIQVTPQALTLAAGETSPLTVQVLPANATNPAVLYVSADLDVATVSDAGVVSGVGVGQTQVTVLNPSSGISKLVDVTVTEELDTECIASGTINYDRYEGIDGNDLNLLKNAPNYPDNPTFSSELALFQAPTNVAESYGARVYGYLCPPESGVYYFWISADDHAELNLSSDANPTNIQTIAGFEGWTNPLEWNKFPGQKSVGINLLAGKTYYIEAFVKEGGGGDHLAVGWRKPSDADGATPVEIIPGSVLSAELLEQPSCDEAGGPPVATVSSSDASCETADGSFTFTFEDNANRTNIEFSIDGGVTYPYNVVDTAGSTTVDGLAKGAYELWVRWGNDDCPQYLGEYFISDTCETCTADGFILMERYENIPGSSLNNLLNAAKYPNNPDEVISLNSFEIPSNVLEEYGVRVRGLLCVPETGNYTFWVAGDDNSQLSLSTDATAANASVIASVPVWTAPQEWTKFAEQQSVSLFLEKGKTYFIEALMKEGGGGDNLAVGWRKPSDGPGAVPTEVIPGAHLSPYSEVGTEPCESINFLAQGVNDGFAGGQDLGTYNVLDNGATLQVANNGWKYVLLDYEVGPNTILEFEFSSPIQGEQHAIGLTNGNNINQPHAFTLYGTQVINDDIDDFKNYTGGTQSYTIPVGQFYTGTMDRLFFVTDHDGGGQNGISLFSNVKIYEEGECGAVVSSLNVSPSAAQIFVNQTLQLETEILPVEAAGASLVYSSSNTAVLTVSQSGVVTALQAGNAVVTVETAAGGVSSSSVIEVLNLNDNCTSSTGPPLTTVLTTEGSCEVGPSITFNFEDHPNRTNIEFSIDGGASYPYNVSDASGSLTLTDLANGDYDLWVRWGNNQCPVNLGQYTLTTSCQACSAEGSILMEQYENIPGISLNDLFNSPKYPNSPDAVSTLTSFEIPINVLDNYGVRVRGFLCAPETGNYTFWISGDDNSQLSLSSDD